MIACSRIRFRSLFPFSLLDYSIVIELVPVLLFALVICTVLSELVGISFEQAKFVLEDQLPLAIVLKVHWFKLPNFIVFSLPFALLIAATSSYTKLAHEQIVVALQSFGVSRYRLLVPVLALSGCMAIAMFTVQELIVPEANYQAAIILERQWNVDRTQLNKYNKQEIIYQEFEADNRGKSLTLLFFARRFDGKAMQELILTRYEAQQIRQIIVANSAVWNQSEKRWQLYLGKLYKLNQQGEYQSIKNFDQLSLELTSNIFDYANHHRDNREMSTTALYHRLEIVKHTNNTRKIKELQTSIQTRYAGVFSCLTFALLGSACGISSRTKNNHSFGIAAIAIMIYLLVQFISTALATAGIIPLVLGVWLPNLLMLLLSGWMLTRSYKT